VLGAVVVLVVVVVVRHRASFACRDPLDLVLHDSAPRDHRSRSKVKGRWGL
jgi:hypothetical protein